MVQSRDSGLYLGVGLLNKTSLCSNLQRSQRVVIQHCEKDEHKCGIFILGGNWGKGGWLRRNFYVSRGMGYTDDRLEFTIIPANSSRCTFRHKEEFFK